MNILDGIISFISPKAGYKRESYRQALNETRSNYDAGGYGRVNNNWKAINQNAELTDKFDRDTIRARARDLERNSNMMNSIVLAFKRNVIGKGFTLQAQTDSQELNQELEDAWLEWCKKRNCDVTGTQSLNQMLKMAVVRKRIDGGILFYKCVNKQNGAMLPFQLQAIEVDELDIGRLQPKYTGNIVVSGIETTAYGKPVGYWFKQESPDGMYLGESKFIEAKDIIVSFKVVTDLSKNTIGALTFSGLKEELSSRWEKHYQQGKSPKSEYLGMESTTIAMTIELNKSLLHPLKTTPWKIRSKLIKMLKNRTAGYLVIGGRKISGRKFVITSISNNYEIITRTADKSSKDKLYKIVCDIVFEEVA